MNGDSMKDKNKILAITIIIGVLLLFLGTITWFLLSGESFSSWPLIMLVVLALLVLFSVIFAVSLWRGKISHEPDYYAIFIMGILWFPLGFVFEMWPLSLMGAIFLVIGLKNKNKWKKKKFSEMEPGQRKLKIALMIILGILVLGGMLAFYFFGT